MNITTSHVLLEPSERRAAGSFAVVVDGKSLPDVWWSIHPPIAGFPREGKVTFVDRPWKGARGIAAAKPKVLPLGDSLHELVVEKALAKVISGDGFTKRTVSLKGAGSYVLFDVHARIPIDRLASAADVTLESGWFVKANRLQWSKDVELPRMFRLLEAPEYLFVARDIADAIKAAKGKVSVNDYARDGGHVERLPPNWSLAQLKPPFPTKNVESAARAFWSLYAGEGGTRAIKSLRATALEHPWWAFAVARCIDCKASNDTRRAACAHPITAARYAVEVDGKAHPDTRKASQQSGLSILHYANFIDRKLDAKQYAKVIRDAGHDKSTLAKHVEELAEVARFLSGGVGVTVAVATPPSARKWPKHNAARYAEAVSATGKSKTTATITHVPFDADVRSDVDAFIPRGYKRLRLPDSATPEDVVTKIMEYVEDIQRGKRKIKSAKERTILQMELGCAWGEQLHRALGWQWAKVTTPSGQGGLALISPDRGLAHYPFVLMGNHLAPKSRSNTVLLIFNMLAANDTPASKENLYTTIQ